MFDIKPRKISQTPGPDIVASPPQIINVEYPRLPQRRVGAAAGKSVVGHASTSETVNNNIEAEPVSIGGCKVTFLPSVYKPEEFEEWTLSKALGLISSGEHKAQIISLRSLSETEQQVEKKKLPAYAFNGTFNNSVINANFKQSSGIILLDLDGLDSLTIEADKARIAAIPSVVFCFVSPSGKGLKVGLRIASDEIKSDADFKQVLFAAEAMFRAYDFVIDPACKDVRRLCFVSHDPAIFINWDVEEFKVERTKETAPITNFFSAVVDTDNEAQKIDCCIEILKAATPGNRHDARLKAGHRAGGLVAGGQVNEQKITDALIQASDHIADGGSTSDSEIKTLLGAVEQGKTKPLYPAKESFNETLDTEHINCKADLLSHVGDDHPLKQICVQLAKETSLPANTVFLVGLAVYSSMAARGFVVLYENRQVLPLGLYVVVEQPSGAGKSRCLNYFKQPFRRIQQDAAADVKQQIESLNAQSKKQKLTDAQQDALSDLKLLAEYLNNDLFITNPTAEGLESTLHGSGGYFCVASSEQGLFGALFGYLYKSSKSSNNNDVVLNGYDGGHISTARVGRKGYNGYVVGSVVCFAQQGSIEKLLSASNGTGLAERFLMLAEPHTLGRRDHTATVESDAALTNRYVDACEFFTDVVGKRTDLHDLEKLVIPKSGFDKIKQFKNQIEPHLIDGGKYSHISLRGAASKVDMQIMKIAAVLHLMGRNDADNKLVILDRHVDSAIGIANELLEASLMLCRDKGIVGVRAGFTAIINYLTARSGGKSERDIINSLSKTLPFKDYTGSKSELVKSTLSEMVDQNLLRRTVDGLGKSIYCLAQ